MDIKDLQAKVKGIKQNLDYTLNTPREKEILAQTVKLNEEVGELCNDILGILKLQRQSKLEHFDKRNMYQEFADVLITLFQLAGAANVDMDRAVRDKIKSIKTRIESEESSK